MFRCPGQDQRYWKPEDIFDVKCPGCGKGVECLKEEPKLKCRNCGQLVANPRIDLGCAEWCKYAEQCLGVSAGKEANAMRKNLIEEIKSVFGSDQKRIDHTLKVLDYAEQIHAGHGGDPLVVNAPAILHDIGIHQPQCKHNSAAGRFQEIEGPPLARRILAKYKLDGATVEHICKIIANHHSAKDIDTLEFKIIWDADWMVNLPDEFPDMQGEQLQGFIEKTFKTDKGRQLATEKFLKK